MLTSQRKFCVHHLTMHQFTVSHHSNHIGRVYVCLAVTCHMYVWQNDRDLLHATVVTFNQVLGYYDSSFFNLSCSANNSNLTIPKIDSCVFHLCCLQISFAGFYRMDNAKENEFRSQLYFHRKDNLPLLAIVNTDIYLGLSRKHSF